MPQNFPALTAQVGAAGGTAIEVDDFDVVDEVFKVVFVLDVGVGVVFAVVLELNVDDVVFEVVFEVDVATGVDARVVFEVDVDDVVFVVEVIFWLVRLLVVVAVLGIETAVAFAVVAAAPEVRYQFACGSWRHSPAVTPFQPLAWIKPK